MTYQTPEHRLEVAEVVLRHLSEARRPILTTHLNADGDGAGSEVALASWFRAQGKEAWIINPTPYPKAFRFLLEDGSWALDAGSGKAKEVARKADLAIVVDTGEVSRIGSVGELVAELPTVIIDHHPAGPDPIAGECFRDTEAAATGELVFDLMSLAGGPWPPDAALGLYVAVLTDTGSFRFSNTRPGTHRLAAALLEKGVDPARAWGLVYGNVSLRRLLLLRASLDELEVDPDNGLAWMTVPPEAYQALGARPDDLEGLVDYPRRIEGVEIGVLFRQTARGATKVSFRSNGPLDVNALAGRFGGGGHAKAAGALVNGPLPQVREEVLAEVRAAVRKGAGREGGGNGGP